MIKVFNIVCEFTHPKKEYKKVFDVIKQFHIFDIYELHSFLAEDQYFYQEIFDKNILEYKENTPEFEALFYEVKKYLMDNLDIINYLLDQEYYTIDFKAEDIYKDTLYNILCDDSGFASYLLEALFEDTLEEWIKNLEEEFLGDPFSATTWQDALKKASAFLDEEN